MTTYPTLTTSQEIVFAGELRRWSVRASSEDQQFAILTWSKPGRVSLYTVVDWERGIRGPENLVFGFGCETDEEVRAMIGRLTNYNGEIDDSTEVSYRHWVWLRFSDWQPDPRTDATLGELVVAAKRGATRHPVRQNTFYKTAPWAGLSPRVRGMWDSAESAEPVAL